MEPSSLSVCKLDITRVDLAGEPAGWAVGTGFLWRQNGQWFVVTNWHNVTGVDPFTNLLHGNFTPNRLGVTLHFSNSMGDGKQVIAARQLFFELYPDRAPIWFEHPNGRAVDCVAVPINPPADGEFPFAGQAINEIAWQQDFQPRVGAECFIVGFPKGLSGMGTTPIWKRGSIATEPGFDHWRKPIFLIDTATREGMSGSPVIVRHHGIHQPTGKDAKDMQFGTIEKFVGMYSGRIGDDELGAQLGIVWKLEAIEEMMAAGVPGVHPDEVN